MIQSQEKNKNILITGGTSGLGLELVRRFLDEGYNVVATGRQQKKLHLPGDRFTFYRIDFGDLKQVSAKTRKICNDHSISLVVNNAGVLSPSAYTETIDGLEYTFQINFLSHLLINEIVLSCSANENPIRIATITSPVRRFASICPVNSGSEDYNPIRAYSSSKLYMALMNEFLAVRHGSENPECFSFDPGTFSSGIYRMQKGWFRGMYRIAAPFMRSPVSVAKVLTVYRQKSLPGIEKQKRDAFIDSCYKLIDPFLN
jgi:NAD(P)-dependent dehydrogenase (short-subunit alcohol dehydrogenase family)